MAKNRLEFPQISREFNAKLAKVGVKIVILGVMALFLTINLFPNLSPDFFVFEQAKLAVMLSPNDLNSHLFLAREYLKRGNMEAVERELTIAQNLTNRYPLAASPSVNSSILGASLSPAKILEKIKNEPQRIKQEIAFWEKVVSEKPDYRDAYLQLAILNYQIYETDKAKGYLNKALGLDPNFAPARELRKIIF